MLKRKRSAETNHGVEPPTCLRNKYSKNNIHDHLSLPPQLIIALLSLEIAPGSAGSARAGETRQKTRRNEAEQETKRVEAMNRKCMRVFGLTVTILCLDNGGSPHPPSSFSSLVFLPRVLQLTFNGVRAWVYGPGSAVTFLP